MPRFRSLPAVRTIAATVSLAFLGTSLPQVALGAETQATDEVESVEVAVTAVEVPQSGSDLEEGPAQDLEEGSGDGLQEESGVGGTESSSESEVVVQSAVTGLGTIKPFTSALTRLGGSNRYATSRQVAARFNAPVPAVFVATGNDFPDALSAGAAAATMGAPLLLTAPSGMDAATLAQITSLKPANVFVVGGTGAVSDYVMDQLQQATGKIPQRIGGSDRYATSLSIAQQFFSSTKFAVIATGSQFADALTASGVAGAKSGPVVLVNGEAQRAPASVTGVLSGLGVKEVLIAGGTAAVSSGIAKQLGGQFSVTRKGGSDRYATAAAVNTAYFAKGKVREAFVATGTNFPDALSGAAMAGRMGSPLYITKASCMPPAVATSVSAIAPAKRVVFGGEAAVSTASAKGTKCVPTPSSTTSASPLLYTLAQLQFHGVINWNSYKFTYYSQSVLPGGGLSIPGRHVNTAGYVADTNGYIVLAAPRGVARGTIFNTPFGSQGKVYDTCASCTTSPMWLDVYTK